MTTRAYPESSLTIGIVKRKLCILI